MNEAPALFDDYRPGLTAVERATQQHNLDLIVRAVANRSGRAPRCLPILTAEDLPYGESTKGRGLLVEVRKGDFLKETPSAGIRRPPRKAIFRGRDGRVSYWLRPPESCSPPMGY